MSTTAPCPIDLWIWPLDLDGERIARLRRILSEDELERADRFVMERDRTSFIAARGGLREILAERVADHPAALAFAYSEHGKPSLMDGPRFNLSHSGSRAALVIADIDLGVDIELVRTIKEDLARDNFSTSEQEELAALPPRDRQAGFFRCWTRKEAIIKATGEGFARDLMSFDVTLSENDPRLLRIDGDNAAAWQIAHFEPEAGYIGAIACRTGGAQIKLTRRSA